MVESYSNSCLFDSHNHIFDNVQGTILYTGNAVVHKTDALSLFGFEGVYFVIVLTNMINKL